MYAPSITESTGTSPPASSRAHALSISISQEGPQLNKNSRKPRRERKAACTECRQQKLKCDLHLDPHKPCARCSKFNLTCFQSLGFRRVEVRKAQKAKSSHGDDSNLQNQSLQHRGNADSSSTPVAEDKAESALPDSFQPTYVSPNFEQWETFSPPTQSRLLSDIHVSDKIIDECFDIFFSNYSPLLPLIAVRSNPNDFYQRSFILFWAIIAIGSRSLGSDPTLLQAIGPEVVNVALTSFQLRRHQLDDIRGLLLLCTWPCPSTTLLKDNTVALSGLLLSLSMQAGLHVPTSTYAHLTGPGTEKQSNRQVELGSLWANVVVACQSVMVLGGYPSIVSFTNMASCSFEKTSWQLVPYHLKLRYKTLELLSKTETVIIELGLDNAPNFDQNILSTRIELAEAQLDSIRMEFCSDICAPLDEIHIQIIRLLLEVLHLYCNGDENNQMELTLLFTTASALITSVKALDDTTSIASYAPAYLTTSISLAAFTLLRMAKSYFEQILDPVVKESGISAIFVAIHLLKRMSLVNNDTCAKSAEFLSTMWRKQSFFKPADSHGWWKLRIRNRLWMSVVFDSILVWVESYGCVDGLPAPPLLPSAGLENTKESTGTPQLLTGGTKDDNPSTLIDDRWLYELDWNASLDSLMAEQAR